MSIITIILFFVYTWGLGFGLTDIIRVKESEEFFERNIMRIGIGLGIMPLIIVVLSLLHIPLQWWIFLLVSIAMPLFRIKKLGSEVGIKLTKSTTYSIVVLLLFCFSLFMYTKGAFAYPWLEDDDPWSHALGVSYIAKENTIKQPGEQYFQYFDPYPPGYDGLMGILHQTSDEIMFTLKFFNALIISLGTLFFYYFAKMLMKSPKKALFAAFCMAMIPAFMSHFIWAISLSVTLYFVAFYAAEKIEEEKRWWIIAAVVIGSTLLTSPTHSTYFGILFILYFLTKCALSKQFLFHDFIAGASGLLLSLLWWLPTFFKWGIMGTLNRLGLQGPNLLNVRGTGDRVYSVSDFIFAKSQNMINSPTGLGIVISLLLLVFIVSIFFAFKDMKEKKWVWIALAWLIVMLYAVNAAKMPVRISSFRTWMILAIPVCLLAAQGLWFLFELGKKASIPEIVILIAVVLGVVFTSGVQKYNLNTAMWPPGAFWGSMEELQAYMWLKDADGNAFGFLADGALAGIDKEICVYCDDVVKFREKGVNQSAGDYSSFMNRNSFKYLIIGGIEAKQYGDDAVNQAIAMLASSGSFNIAHQTKGAVVFEAG